jgi:hypothetical protein
MARTYTSLPRMARARTSLPRMARTRTSLPRVARTCTSLPRMTSARNKTFQAMYLHTSLSKALNTSSDPSWLIILHEWCVRSVINSHYYMQIKCFYSLESPSRPLVMAFSFKLRDIHGVVARGFNYACLCKIVPSHNEWNDVFAVGNRNSCFGSIVKVGYNVMKETEYFVSL